MRMPTTSLALGQQDQGPTVLFGQAPRGRVTGWAVACSVHGAMPVLLPGRTGAIRAAGLHIEHEHGGRAQLVESPRPLKAAKPERGRQTAAVVDELERFRAHA